MLALPLVQDQLRRRAGRTAGPDRQRRESTGCEVWGEASNANGKQVAASLKTPNGYTLTVDASLGIVEHLLENSPAGGYYTPSMLMGAEYVLGFPGVSLLNTCMRNAEGLLESAALAPN